MMKMTFQRNNLNQLISLIKKEKINLIVFNFDNLSKLNNDFEEYLLNINKKSY